MCSHILTLRCSSHAFHAATAGVFESWLHPSRYRTQLCKDQEKCDRPVCFFAHNISELRTPVDSFVPNPEERLRVPEATQVSGGTVLQPGLGQGVVTVTFPGSSLTHRCGGWWFEPRFGVAVQHCCSRGGWQGGPEGRLPVPEAVQVGGGSCCIPVRVDSSYFQTA